MNLSEFRYAPFCFAFLLCQTGPASAAEVGCQLDRNNSITTGECLAQIHNAHDVELNEKYQTILRGLKQASARQPDSAEVRAQLIAAQRNWLRFRDSDCKALALHLADDPSVQSRNTACLLARTEQRVKELDRWIAVLPPTVASDPTFSLVELGQPIAGQPLTFWIQRYWQWQRSFPRGSQPSDDSTGIRCGVRQNQPVFFLAGSGGTAPIVRNCTIPRDKYILVPILHVLAQNDGTASIRCEAFMNAVREVNDSAVDLSFTIDDQAIRNLAAGKAESGCFALNDASRGIAGTAAGAGYWIVLKPLRPGSYKFHFSGRYLADGFGQDLSYTIRVE